MNGKQFKRNFLIVDVVVAALVLPLLVWLFPIENLSLWLLDDSIYNYSLYVGVIVVYVAHRVLNIPQMISDKRYLAAALYTGAFIVVAALIINYIVPLIPLPSDDSKIVEVLSDRELWNDNGFYNRVITEPREMLSWILFSAAFAIGFTVCLVEKLTQQAMMRHEMERQMKEVRNNAELAMYKAQINPHFMFNALNSLYAMVLSKSDATEEAFVKFTNILKYMYNNADKEFIALSEELEYIKQYVDLQKLRINKHTVVEFTHSIENGEQRIAPMLLITFVENAFKYGVTSSQVGIIRIDLSQNDGVIRFSTFNKINPKKVDSKGIGIENCRKRLALLFPDRHRLEITKGEEEFRVNLEIY